MRSFVENEWNDEITSNSCLLTVFDHILNREEFENVFPLNTDQIINYTKLRINLINNLNQCLDLRIYFYGCFWKLDNSDECENIIIAQMNRGASMFNYCIPSLSLFIEGGYEFTDNIYIFEDSVDISKFVDCCNKSGFYILPPELTA